MKVKFKSTILENSNGLEGFVLSLKNEFGNMTIDDEVFKLTTKAPIQFFMRPGRIDIVSFVTTITMENIKTSEKSEMDFRTLLKAENLMDALLEVIEESHEKNMVNDSKTPYHQFNTNEGNSSNEFENLLTSLSSNDDESYLDEFCATTDETEEVKFSPLVETVIKNIEKENILNLIDFYLEQKELNYDKLTELSNMLKSYE